MKSMTELMIQATIVEQECRENNKPGKLIAHFTPDGIKKIEKIYTDNSKSNIRKSSD